MLNDTTITEALRNVQDPELHRDIVSLDMVKDVRIDGTSAYSNKVQGNAIGTNLSGNTSGLGNGKSGVSITGGAHDNTIGGTTAGASR